MTSCEPDVRVTIDAPSATPNDPDYTNGGQWDIPLINVPAVWQQQQFGSSAVKVCMVCGRRVAAALQARPLGMLADCAACSQIDTGVDLQHPDIQANLWTNPQEVRASGANAANGYINGRDDDGNGVQACLSLV